MPFATRQTAANHARSRVNSGESGVSVCNVVSEYLIPYWLKVIAGAHLAAKAIPPVRDSHVTGVSGVA